jgi:hypothetical protein
MVLIGGTPTNLLSKHRTVRRESLRRNTSSDVLSCLLVVTLNLLLTDGFLLFDPERVQRGMNGGAQTRVTKRTENIMGSLTYFDGEQAVSFLGELFVGRVEDKGIDGGPGHSGCRLLDDPFEAGTEAEGFGCRVWLGRSDGRLDGRMGEGIRERLGERDGTSAMTLCLRRRRRERMERGNIPRTSHNKALLAPSALSHPPSNLP